MAWARQLAPDLVEVTAEGLAMLRLQRRQRLEALLAPGDLLGLKCSAGELRSYPRAVAQLRDLGSSPGFWVAFHLKRSAKRRVWSWFWRFESFGSQADGLLGERACRGLWCG